ncbi:hypothetical protein [Stenotrophomonas rhizophila]
MLSQKADKSAVADVAGVLVSSIRRDFIEADRDPQGNVAFAVHRDGTREFIGTKVGGYRISRDGEDSALITGRADNRGVYQEYAQDLTGTAFADALEIDINELGRVGRVKWKGRVRRGWKHARSLHVRLSNCRHQRPCRYL